MPDNAALRAAIDSLEEELAQHRSAVTETMKLINGLHRRMGEPPPYKLDQADDVPVGSALMIGPDEFFDHGRPSDATEALLKKLKRATKIEDAIKMLKDGGFKFSGKDEAGALRTAIGKDSRFVKFDETDTVGLLDWYPKRKRAKLRSSANGGTEADGDEGSGQPEASSGQDAKDE